MSEKDNRNDRLADFYHIHRPSGPGIPLVFDSPHSGSTYPDDFHYACSLETLRRAEDNEVDVLFGSAPAHGATLLAALFPRTYIDVNRAVDDIDMDLLNERWPGPLNPSQRSYAGIGLIRRLVKPGIPVYDRDLSVAEIMHRLDHYYHPYHAALKSLLDDAHYRFGQVWHVNCHSMPGSPAPVMHGVLHMQPDIVLGDRDGTSCDLEFTHMIRDTLRGLGYRVAINNPYKGVEIVRRSASPAEGRHSLQIEINKSLYWDEQKNRRKTDFKATQEAMEKLIASLASWVRDHLSSMAAD